MSGSPLIPEQGYKNVITEFDDYVVKKTALL